MRYLTLLVLLLTANAYAAIKSFDVQNLHLNFENQTGRASADIFQMIFDFGDLNLNGYDIDIQKGEGQLLFTKPDTNFLLRNVDQSVLDAVSALSAERIDVKGVANKSLDLNFQNGAISLGDEIHGLSSMTLNCHTNTRGDDTLISFLIPCFDNGSLRIPEIRLSKKSMDAAVALLKSFPPSPEIEDPAKSIFLPKKIEDIELDIVEQVFNLTLKARFIFKLKLEIKGSAILNQKKDVAVFDIQQAKVGFLSVKGLVLKILSKLEVTNVTVEGSIITIKL